VVFKYFKNWFIPVNSIEETIILYLLTEKAGLSLKIALIVIAFI
jgi:hypothetical protein